MLFKIIISVSPGKSEGKIKFIYKMFYTTCMEPFQSYHIYLKSFS